LQKTVPVISIFCRSQQAPPFQKWSNETWESFIDFPTAAMIMAAQVHPDRELELLEKHHAGLHN
jgi:hypothetical protein